MGRPPRIVTPDMDYHVIVRCNNGEFLLRDDEDFCRYLAWLDRIRQKHGFLLFNYELMNSHVHLLVRPSERVAFSKSMMEINTGYARDYNRRRKHKGHVWMRRYQCIPVESEEYSLALMRYMNRNPVRAGMVKKAGDWKWSAYSFYAKGASNELITPHAAFLGLGQTDDKRRKEYAFLVNLDLPGDQLRNPAYTKAPAIGSREFIKKFKTPKNKSLISQPLA